MKQNYDKEEEKIIKYFQFRHFLIIYQEKTQMKF